MDSYSILVGRLDHMQGDGLPQDLFEFVNILSFVVQAFSAHTYKSSKVIVFSSKFVIVSHLIFSQD